MTYAILATALVGSAAAFEGWATLRGRRNAGMERHIGRHRPDTVDKHKVDDLHGITYPNLYQQYRRFIDLYGHGEQQAAYWAWRTARIAELRQRAAERRRQRDYGWLAELEAWLADLEADINREQVAS